MNIDDRLGRVPAYDRFYGVDELYNHARKIAGDHPSDVFLSYVGESKSGERIPMVSLGKGPVSILLFASPHPNEPIGAMMAHFLLEELVADPSLLEGRRWNIIPCIDPDGARRNEGWFGGPFSIQNYARNFFRPRGDDQAEWTFPIEYKTFKFDRPIPETKALMAAIDATKPKFMYSLHNSGFGGAYYYISRPLEAAYATLHRLPKERNLPLSLGEPEAPYCRELYPAIYASNFLSTAYDYYEKFGTGDPAAYMFGGASSRDYAEKVSSPFTLVTEVPYFKTAKIGDTTPIGRMRGEVVIEGLGRTRDFLTFVKGIIDETISEVREGAVYRDASAKFIPLLLASQEGERKWAESKEIMGQTATVAQEAHALHVSLFYDALIASMYRRALRAELEARPSAALESAYGRLDEKIEESLDGIAQALDYKVMPIRDLVQIQYGALLACLDALDY
jgi:hypothetical protein